MRTLTEIEILTAENIKLTKCLEVAEESLIKFAGWFTHAGLDDFKKVSMEDADNGIKLVNETLRRIAEIRKEKV